MTRSGPFEVWQTSVTSTVGGVSQETASLFFEHVSAEQGLLMPDPVESLQGQVAYLHFNAEYRLLAGGTTVRIEPNKMHSSVVHEGQEKPAFLGFLGRGVVAKLTAIVPIQPGPYMSAEVLNRLNLTYDTKVTGRLKDLPPLYIANKLAVGPIVRGILNNPTAAAEPAAATVGETLKAVLDKKTTVLVGGEAFFAGFADSGGVTTEGSGVKRQLDITVIVYDNQTGEVRLELIKNAQSLESMDPKRLYKLGILCIEPDGSIVISALPNGRKLPCIVIETVLSTELVDFDLMHFLGSETNTSTQSGVQQPNTQETVPPKEPTQTAQPTQPDTMSDSPPGLSRSQLFAAAVDTSVLDDPTAHVAPAPLPPPGTKNRRPGRK
jgi:hypothetical protein